MKSSGFLGANNPLDKEFSCDKAAETVLHKVREVMPKFLEELKTQDCISQ